MKKLTGKMIKEYLKKVSGESGEMEKGDGFWMCSGKEGKKYSEYSYGSWFVCLDGSMLYEAFNYGSYGWSIMEGFMAFLQEYGYYFELGNAWNMSIQKS